MPPYPRFSKAVRKASYVALAFVVGIDPPRNILANMAAAASGYSRQNLKGKFFPPEVQKSFISFSALDLAEEEAEEAEEEWWWCWWCFGLL